MRQLVSLVFWLSLTVAGLAQPKQFSADSSQFVHELEAFIENSLQTDAEKLAFEQFAAIIRSDSLLSVTARAEVIDVFNLFLRKKARPAPHFLDYIQCYVYFTKYQRAIPISKSGKNQSLKL